MEQKIIDLKDATPHQIEQLAEITYFAFANVSPGWLADVGEAKKRVLTQRLPDGFGLVLLEKDGHALGWIGAIQLNHGRVWEVHPLAITPAEQGKGLGRLLVAALTEKAKESGVLSLFAGASDETGATNLYGVDLYDDPLGKLAAIQFNGPSPISFWLRVGFKIIGLMPNEEGLGKPGVHLAKRIE